MNKTQLIAEVAQRAEIDRKTVAAILDAFTSTVVETVARGEDVNVAGFGKWEQVHKPARTARNPRTGQPVEVAETWVPKFRPGGEFKATVAKGARLEPVAA